MGLFNYLLMVEAHIVNNVKLTSAAIPATLLIQCWQKSWQPKLTCLVQSQEKTQMPLGLWQVGFLLQKSTKSNMQSYLLRGPHVNKGVAESGLKKMLLSASHFATHLDRILCFLALSELVSALLSLITSLPIFSAVAVSAHAAPQLQI